MTDLSIAVDEAPTQPVLLRLLEVAWLVAATFLGALAHRALFTDVGPFVGRAAAAVAGGAAVALVAERRRWRPGRAFVVALVALAVFLAYGVLSDTLAAGLVPTGDTIAALRAGLGHGFADALGDTLPLASARNPLLLVLAATWTAAYGATDLARRTALVAVPVLPAIALLALALPLTAPAGGPSAVLVGLFVLAAFVAILLRAAPRAAAAALAPSAEGAEATDRSLLGTRLGLGLPIVAVLAVAAPAAGLALLADRDPFDPRELRDEAITLDRVTDPLAEYRAVVKRVPAQSLFRVSFSGVSALDVARVPVLTLDTYDGVRWGSADRFTKAGSIAEPDEPDRAVAAAADVFVSRLPNVYLPRLSAPSDFDLDGVLVDQTSGDMIVRTPPEAISYRVTGRVSTATGDALAGARAATDADARYTDLDTSLPPALANLTQVTQGAGSAGEAMVLLETALRTSYANDEQAAGGASVGRLERFVTERRGAPEQFASAFVLVARSLGYPARVVLGYKVTEERNGTVAPLADISTAQYHVWAEVDFEGLGWVDFDPTPKPGQTPPPPTQGQAPPTTLAEGGGSQQQPDELGPSEAPDTAEPPSSVQRLLQAVGLSIAILAAIAGSLVALVLLGKQARRRRQQRGDGAAQVSGAWEGVLDRLGEVGMTLPSSMTPREIAQAAEARFGTAITLPMSAIVPDLGRAVYGSTEPDDALVDRVGQRAEEFRQNLYGSLSRRDRIAARLNPRPLARR